MLLAEYFFSFYIFLAIFFFIFLSCSSSFYNLAINTLFDILWTSRLIFFFVFKGDFLRYEAL